MSKMREIFGQVLNELYLVNRRYASLPILLGLLNGIIPFLCLPDISFLRSFICSFPFVVLFLPALKRHGASRSPVSNIFLKVALFTLIGWGVVLCNVSLPDDHYDSISNNKNYGAVLEARIIDTSCVGEQGGWLGNPKLVYADVLRMKYSEYDGWRSCSGKVMLKLRDAPLLRYGDIVCARGVFTEPEAGIYSGSGFSNYLRSRGVYKIFEAQSLDILDHTSGFVDLACRFRNTMMNYAVYGVRDKVAKVVAALFFGCKQGVPYKTKESFFLSGASHAFAISGLHIGILSVLALTTLKLLPVRLRFFVLPFVLLLYVVTVGIRVSAIRALIMISVWAFHRALLYKTSPVNIIFYTASTILLFSPFSLVDIGFQYSFVTVFFLVVSWTFVSRWWATFAECRGWKPSSEFSVGLRFVLWWKRWFFQSVSFCTLAWMSSSALAALYSGFYILTAVLVNLCLIPLLVALFFSVFVKLLIPVSLAHYGAVGIEFIVGCLLHVCHVGGDHGVISYVSGVFGLAVAVYYLAILVGVTSRSAVKATVSMTVIVLVMLSMHSLLPNESKEVVVLNSGVQPVVVIIENDRKSVSIINCGSYELGMDVCALLQTKGITEVRKLIVAGQAAEYYKGVGYLCDKLNVGSLYVATKGMRVGGVQYLRSKCHLNGVKFVELVDVVVDNGGRVVVSRNGVSYTVSYRGVKAIISKSPEGVFTLDVDVGEQSKFQSYEPTLNRGATVI